MGADPRIDAYITSSADFAKPVLEHIRKLVHKACPDIQETMKWSFPHFDYKGIVCSMAAFKYHCSFTLWKASLLEDKQNYLSLTERDAMGNFGKITSLNDLPPDNIIIGFVKQAVKLNEEGVRKTPVPKKAIAKEVVVPDELSAFLSKNKKAKATFDVLSPSHRKEYIEWIEEAKTASTREKRVATTIEWLEEGKSLNWKYKK